MTLGKTNFRILVGVVLLGLTPLVYSQDAYPSRPVRLIVPSAAGGLPDIFARMISDRLTKAISQNVWVDNKPGASGIIAMETLSKSPSDGYTIGLGPIGPMAINPSLFPKLPYDSLRDFTPISLMWSGPMVVLVEASSPIKTLQELVRMSGSRPGGLDVATPGNATLQHITAELFKNASGAKLNHVPHRGSAQAIANVLGGHVPVMIDTASASLAQVRAGRLRPLAVSTPERLGLLPDVPTIVESGYAGVITDGWLGLVGPANLPDGVRQRLNAEVRKIIESPEAKGWAATQGGVVKSSTPDELGGFMKAEISRLAVVIRSAGIKAE